MMNDIEKTENLTIQPLDEPHRTQVNSTQKKKHKKPTTVINPRSASRLVAVQALYTMDISRKRPSEVVDDIKELCYPDLAVSDSSDSDKNSEITIPHNFDADYTSSILYGVVREQRVIDPMISSFLPESWHFSRLDKVLCSILRAAIYELLFSPAIPPKVTINEYTNIASSFHLNDDNALINGILNAVARSNNLL